MRDEVCSLAMQVATAVLCEALRGQLKFISQARVLSSLVGVLSEGVVMLAVHHNHVSGPDPAALSLHF